MKRFHMTTAKYIKTACGVLLTVFMLSIPAFAENEAVITGRTADAGKPSLQEARRDLYEQGYGIKDIKKAEELSALTGKSPEEILKIKGKTTFKVNITKDSAGNDVETLVPDGKTWEEVGKEIGIDAKILDKDMLRSTEKDRVSVSYYDGGEGYNSYIYPYAAYKKVTTPPFAVSDASREEISTATGDLTVKQQDLYLKGINGLDFSLTRYYSLSESNLYDPRITEPGNDTYIYVVRGTRNLYKKYWQNNAYHYELIGTTYNATACATTSQQWAYDLSQSLNANQEDSAYYDDNLGSLVTIDYINCSYYNYGYASYKYDLKEDKLEDQYFNIGAGWSLDLPYIEIRYERYRGDGYRAYEYLHYGSKGVLEILNEEYVSFGKDSSGLADYELSDIRVRKLKSSSYSVDGRIACYVMYEKDGRETYFEENGRIIGIKDRFGNQIRFFYQVGSNGYLLLSKIIDSAGREINISYAAANKVTVTVVDPTNSGNTRTIVYNKEQAGSTYAGKYVLKSVVDPEGRTTSYNYVYQQSRLSFTDKNLDGMDIVRNTTYNQYICANNDYACLDEIIYPTGGKTCYNYSKQIKNCGIDGVMEFYKVKERYDVDSRNENKKYNYQKYTYRYGGTGEYDGYNRYSDIWDIPDSYVTKTLVQDDLGNSEIDTYNKKLLCINKLSEGANHKNEIINTYEPYTNLLTKSVNRIYNKVTGNYIENIQSYQYDTYQYAGFDAYSYGDLIASWDSQSEGNTADLEHKTTYTYDPAYHILINKKYKQDINTVIEENYTLNSDKKTVRQEQKRRAANSVIYIVVTKDYTYDSKGNITQEKITTGSTPIVTNYSYTDNDPLRNGRFNGVYATRKWSEGVKDADGNPAVSPTPGTIEETYKYDWFGNITEHRDGNGNTTVLAYDKLGREIRETNPDGSYKQWTYTSNTTENSVTVTDENYNSGPYSAYGSRIKYVYDQIGNMTDEYIYDSGKNELVRAKMHTYDTKCRETIELTFAGGMTTYTYTSDGRPAGKKTEGGGLVQSESYTYDDAYAEPGTNMKYMKTTKTIQGDAASPSIVTTTYINKHGWLEKQGKVHNGVEYADTFRYDYLGNKTEEKTARAYAEGWPEPYTTKYEHLNARTFKETDINGYNITTDYDSEGKIISRKDQKGNPTDYKYDALGRLLEENTNIKTYGGPSRSSKKYYYDANGNVIKEKILRNGGDYIETGYEYNSRNLLTRVITYNNGVQDSVTRYTYDPSGNKLTQAGAGADPTRYEYNSIGKLTKMTDPMGKAETYKYDTFGNMTEKTDRNGNKTAMSYDVLNRLLQSRVTTPGGTEQITVNRYSLTGNTAAITDNGKETSYAYDDLGRVVSETGPGGIEKQYAYDWADNRASMTIRQNGQARTSTTYAYDKMNRLYQVYENGQVTATYGYDQNGNRTSLDYANGDRTEYIYNVANKLDQLINKKGSQVLSQYTYYYSAEGNRIRETDISNKVTTYTYDGVGRLVTEQAGSEPLISYTYDDRNNRKTMTVQGVSTTSYEYDQNNRLIAETKVAGQVTEITRYGYDDNGNQIYKATETIKAAVTGDTEKLIAAVAGEDAETSNVTISEYDGLNRLIRVATGNTIATYTYRWDGLRTSKTVNGVTTQHIWDGDQMALELDGAGNVTSKYVRGINLINAQDATGTTRYYLYDGHGDVIQLTDAAGNVIKSYEYDAFGNEKNPDANDTNVFRYCGGNISI
jgi:YD repeat-containing protein